ncbi:MAG: cytochrome c oxidase subunit 4 [Microbacteriaceae bacterium]|nr:cytochrome c oxidase subunit 4 [Microbacteriaceae bacterium]
MHINRNVFVILTVFFLLVAALYTAWSVIDFHSNPAHAGATHVLGVEWVGTITLALCAGLSGLIAFYLAMSQRAVGGVLPEDRQDAEIDDGDPEVGYFSPWSWWPIALAFGAALVFLGLAVGIWVSFIGAPIAFLAIVGWYYEYYRGNFAR